MATSLGRLAAGKDGLGSLSSSVAGKPQEPREDVGFAAPNAGGQMVLQAHSWL